MRYLFFSLIIELLHFDAARNNTKSTRKYDSFNEFIVT